jgi:hypothetical protein
MGWDGETLEGREMAAASTATFDARTLRQGLERPDPDKVTSLFHDDAECVVIDKNHPPSSPLLRAGKEEIGEFNRYLFGPGKTHRVESLVVGGDSAAFSDACQYEDGTRVHCNAVLDIDGGEIRRMVCVQAWDE